MEPEIEAALDAISHCLLVIQAPTAPSVSRPPVWYDGSGLWLALSSDADEVEALRASPRCLIYEPRADGADLSGEGLARVYDADDPVTLAAHAPMIAAALAALAVKHLAEVVSRVRSLVRDPPDSLPPLPAVVRVTLERAAFEPPVSLVAGVAPALPAEVPAAVRRALSGQRRIALATQDEGRPRMGPAVWSSGFKLTLPTWRRASPGARAVAVAQADGDGQPPVLALEGPVGEDGQLLPARASWWSASERGVADLADPTAAAVELPD